MVLDKILKFSLSLLFLILGLNILVDFVLEKKLGFLDYKSDITRKSKTWDIFKGVNPWLWLKF